MWQKVLSIDDVTNLKWVRESNKESTSDLYLVVARSDKLNQLWYPLLPLPVWVDQQGDKNIFPFYVLSTQERSIVDKKGEEKKKTFTATRRQSSIMKNSPA